MSTPNSKKTTLFALALLCFGTIAFQSCTEPKVLHVDEHILTDGWQIIASADANADGKAISSPEQNTDAWISAKVPTTVLAALVEAGVHPDPFYADNLDKISPEPFQNPWWFRKTFALDDLSPDNESLRLFIDGITYRANIWLNGVQIASQDTLYGSFRQFSIDISNVAKPSNVLAFEIFPPQPRDFYMGFVDWAPMPPDKYMGIYREVRVKRSGKVTLDKPFVKTDVNTETLSEASLTIEAELTNNSGVEKQVTISGIIENIKISKDVTLAPNSSETISFIPAEFANLNISNPRLWWPNGLGKPEMYALRLQVHENGVLNDEQNVNFGIRKVETYLNASQVRGYKVNGREVLIKSGGWVDDLLLRYQPEKDAAQIRYVKEMNMNSIRLEGFWGNNHNLYDLCDQNGILIMVGWSCQWEWPDYLGLELEIAEGDENLSIAEGTEIYGVKISLEEENLLSDYFRDQVIWLRNHPSIFCWAVGSDAMPKPSLEQKYQTTLDQYDDTRSLLVSAGQFESTLSGPSGMKMNGPYEYVPPVYWFEDQKLGGAFGFNSETGPGPQIPPVSSIKIMAEAYWWPPMNPMWDYHSGREDFDDH
ncbi:MAG: glycoside hydrolase family 2 TIM barrel-domain containing protein [Cyclobacteriaceae bacterium]|nr:glycoside hydrolase family 2 TIM barrel-domain containing protein [Cyclobacteriaceae bacterium]